MQEYIYNCMRIFLLYETRISAAVTSEISAQENQYCMYKCVVRMAVHL